MNSNLIFVSIILPTYNDDEAYLKQSIESILNQTHKNFELIIIDDGSCKNQHFLSSINDCRIKLLHNGQNYGLVYTLNKGLDIAKGKYIFRMDADDVSKKNRLKTCINFMEKNTSVSVLGSNIIYFGQKKGRTHFPQTDNDIKASLLFENVLAHPTIVFRKETIDKYCIKYSSEMLSEDYHLWISLLITHPDLIFKNLQSRLLNYRIHKNQITQSKRFELHKNGINIQMKILNTIGINMSDEENTILYNFSENLLLTKKEYIIVFSILNNILYKNLQCHIFNERSLRQVIIRKSLKHIAIQIIRYKKIDTILLLLLFAWSIIKKENKV